LLGRRVVRGGCAADGLDAARSELRRALGGVCPPAGEAAPDERLRKVVGFRVALGADGPGPVAPSAQGWQCRYGEYKADLDALESFRPQDAPTLLAREPNPLSFTLERLSFRGLERSDGLGLGDVLRGVDGRPLAPGRFVDLFVFSAAARPTLPAGRWFVRTLADDGVRVWARDRLVVDTWGWSTHGAAVGAFEVPAAGPVPLRAEYLEIMGHAQLLVDLVPDR
jgi:hypothetical protein